MVLFLHQTLQQDKFEDADFKYDNSIFKFQKYYSQKYQIKTFLVTNLGIFVSSRNFDIRQTRGCWFQVWQYFF